MVGQLYIESLHRLSRIRGTTFQTIILKLISIKLDEFLLLLYLYAIG